MRYGAIADIQVNWYTTGAPMSNRQEVYAFVTFMDQHGMQAVLRQPTHVQDGLTLICTMPHDPFRSSEHSIRGMNGRYPTATTDMMNRRDASVPIISSLSYHSSMSHVTHSPPPLPDRILSSMFE